MFPKNMSFSKWFVLMAILLGLQGCSSFIEHVPAPLPNIPNSWRHAKPHDYWPVSQNWWVGMADPALEAYIFESLENNRDLRATATRVKTALLNKKLGKSEAWSFSTSLGRSDQWQLSNNGSHTQAYSSSLTLGFDADLWGRLAASQQSDELEYQASQADLSQAQLELTLGIAETYWKIGLLDQKFRLVMQALENAIEDEKLTQIRYHEGVVGLFDPLNAKEAILSRQNELLALQQERLLLVYTLEILLGRQPNTLTIDQVVLPKNLPEVQLALPVAVLHAKPDIYAAKLRLDKVLAQLNIAEAARYPNLTLSSGISTGGDDWVKILHNPVASLGLSLALPILDWKRNEIRRDIAQTQYDEAVINFSAKLYKTMTDIEALLANRPKLQQSRTLSEQTLTNTEKQAQIIKARYRHGVVAYQKVREENYRALQAKIQVLQNQMDIISNLLLIYKNLGYPIYIPLKGKVNPQSESTAQTSF